MGKVEDAVATQLRNIESSSGRTLAQWAAAIATEGLSKHGEIVAFLKSKHGFTHGNANAVALNFKKAGAPASGKSELDAQYSGARAPLRPIADRLIKAAKALGKDVEVSPKKTSVSLRRKKQFALVEVPSASRVVLGLNRKDFKPTARLKAAKGMCTHQVVLTSVEEIDAELLGWLAAAYEAAS